MADFGYDDDGAQERDHAGFAALRQELRARGHDTVDYEDGEQVITVALNPEDLTVVARLTPAQAEEVGEVFHSWEDPFDASARLAAVLERVAPEPGLVSSPRRPRT